MPPHNAAEAWRGPASQIPAPKAAAAQASGENEFFFDVAFSVRGIRLGR
jgi:hypothetical protein